MAETVLTFTREKETKNAVRFQEEERAGQPKVIGSLYVQKWFVGDAAALTVSVNAGETSKKKR